MSRVYDNWERLVAATLNREKLRELAFCESLSSSIASDFSSHITLDYPYANGNLAATRISIETISPKASSSQSIPPSAVRPIKLKEIKEATRNFHADLLLGEGRSSRVFKGWIDKYSLTAANPGSGIAIAVKKLNEHSLRGREEWLAEIGYLSQLHHPNLIKLIGHCSEEDNLILVYEFMSRGSLDNHLFGRARRSLSWATRIKVAIGTARALSFLHNREKQVIRGAFPTSDILLDGGFNAKLSGFCWAKNGPTGDMIRISTRIMVIRGYSAPEYMATGLLTAKCDVYAFGAVLLELIAGRQSFEKTRKLDNQEYLVDWVKLHVFDERNLFRIMDTKLEAQYPEEEAYSVALLALKCLEKNPEHRGFSWGKNRFRPLYWPPRQFRSLTWHPANLVHQLAKLSHVWPLDVFCPFSVN